MATITLPEEFAERKDLVAVPRKTFEEFIAWQKKLKSARTFTPTAAEKKALARARKNRARRKSMPLHELRHTVETTR